MIIWLVLTGYASPLLSISVITPLVGKTTVPPAGYRGASQHAVGN